MVKIDALAYVVVQSTDVGQWKQYAENMLGMSTASAADGGLYLKMDEREFRILVLPGAENRYVASGWEVADGKMFDASVAALKQAQVEVQQGSPAERTARRVSALARFTDPSGNVHELSWGYNGTKSEFVSPLGVKGFVTGKFGVGHTVLPTLQFDATLKFFREVLGFGLSDVFNFQPGPDAPNIRIYFLHGASGRHHSLALAEMPNPAGCVHMMVETRSLTDVGIAYDRLQKQGGKLMATLGQHENDNMTSFYMMTPGNFAIEYGWGGIEVDPATWQTTQTKQVSIWGHDFSVGFR